MENEIKNTENDASPALIFTIILSALTIISFGFFVDTYASEYLARPGSIDKSVQVLNDPPLIEVMTVSEHEESASIKTFTPAENENKFLYVYGTVVDGNGCLDILNKKNWKLTIYRSSVKDGPLCRPTNLECYRGASDRQLTISNCQGTGDTHLSYQWKIPIAHYIDATDFGPFAQDDWKVDMQVADDSAGSQIAHTSFEVATLRAINIVQDHLDYGTIKLGDKSSEVSILIENIGNDPVDFDVHTDGPMKCEQGTISSDRVHVGKFEGFPYDKGILSLSENDQWVNVSLAKQSTDARSHLLLYLKLQAPEFGVRGQCKNVITFTATRDR